MSNLSDILSNAIGLLEDAKLLYQHGRYARALTLAVLSMEEVGKFYIIKWHKKDHLSLVRKHKEKQRINAAIDMANFVLDEVNTALGEIGFCLISEDKMSDRQKSWVFSEKGQKFHEEFLQSQETINRVAEAIRQSVSGGILRDLHHGQVDVIKQKSLYVDLDPDGKVITTPQVISQE
jgi:AbiV family abortive infection protein